MANMVTIEVNVTVSKDGSSWRGPYGRGSFNVTIPADALSAIDVSKLVKPLMTQAETEFAAKVAEEAAQAEIERVKAEAEAAG